MESPHDLARIQRLSEKTGIEMIVIDEAEKITDVEAGRFARTLILSNYIDDPIQSTITQRSPRDKSVELPGISFLVSQDLGEKLVDSLNRRLSYRQYLAFISDNRTRKDKMQTISIIRSADKYNILRFQETSGGSYLFSTDSIIEKLQSFDHKYPFQFVGAGDDWILLETERTPNDWTDFSREVLKICPLEEEVNIDNYAAEIKKNGGKVFMWWD